MEPQDNSQCHEEAALGAALPTILLLTGVFLVNFVSRIVLGPLMPVIEQELGLTHGQAGSLFLLISGGYCVVISLSGFVSARLGHRWTVAVSAWALTGGLVLVALSSSLGRLRWGLLILGAAAGLYLPSGMATMTSLVGRHLWGRAIAVHELAPNLGFVMAPFLAELLTGWISWRGVLGVLAVMSSFGGLAFLRWGRGGRFRGTSPNRTSVGILARESDFWLMMWIFGLGVGGSLGVYTMLPLFLVAERGFELGQANSMVGLSRLASMGMAFVGGWASDRFGLRRTMGLGLIVSGIVTVLLGWTKGVFLVIAVFLQPAMAVCFFPAALAALSRIGPAEVRNLTVSLVVPLGFLLGGGGIPSLIGLSGELGRFPLGIASVGVAMVLSGISVRWLCLGEAKKAMVPDR
ncbi:MAG: MFS transporter [Thermodesulfobacteriota bacterium]